MLDNAFGTCLGILMAVFILFLACHELATRPTRLPAANVELIMAKQGLRSCLKIPSERPEEERCEYQRRRLDALTPTKKSPRGR